MSDDKDELIRQLAQRLREAVDENDKLRALVANLTEGATAHTVLQSLYRDPNQPTGHRIKAAQAALGHESAPLKPVEPAIDATCEEIIPLAELVTQRRARADEMLRERREIRVLPSGQVIELKGNGGDSSSD